MIEIFRTNQFFATLLLIPYTFLIRIGSLIYPHAYEVQEFDSPLSKYVFGKLLTSAIWQNILACIVVFLIANFINRLIIQNRMSKILTLFPGLIFILLTAGLSGGLKLSPALISSFFTIVCILNLYKAYKNSDSSVHIFNTGFYIAVAGLFYPACIFLWVFGVIALLNLRSFKIHELIIYISGFLVPFFLLGTYYYWNDKLDLLNDYFQFDQGIFSIFSDINANGILNMVFVGLVILFSIYRYSSFKSKNIIQVQKKIDIVYWFLLFCLLIMFFMNGIAYNHLVFLALPFAYFLGITFEKIKNSLLAEVIHAGVVIFVIYFQFQSIF